MAWPRGPFFGLLLWLGFIGTVSLIGLNGVLGVGLVSNLLLGSLIACWYFVAISNGVWMLDDYLLIVTGLAYRRIPMADISDVRFAYAYVGWPLEMLVIAAKENEVKCTAVAWRIRQSGRIVPEQQRSIRRRKESQKVTNQAMERALKSRVRRTPKGGED